MPRLEPGNGDAPLLRGACSTRTLRRAAPGGLRRLDVPGLAARLDGAPRCRLRRARTAGTPRNAALAWAVAWVVANAVEVLGKGVLRRPTLHVTDGASRGDLHGFDGSFPSGHAMRAVLLAALVVAVSSRAGVAVVAGPRRPSGARPERRAHAVRRRRRRARRDRRRRPRSRRGSARGASRRRGSGCARPSRRTGEAGPPRARRARAAGGLLLAIGLLGLVPAVTSGWSRLAFAGRGSEAKLAGVFQVSVLLDLVHVALGAASLLLAGTAELAHRIVGAGVVLIALWLLGVAKVGGWVPVDLADDWLHLGLGVGMLGLARVTAPDA